MKALCIYLLLICGILAACDDDDNDNKVYRLEGKWLVKNAAPKVWPRQGGEEEQIALEDSLTQYTFLDENTEITFHNDSIRLTVNYMGWSRPDDLPCSLRNDVLNITPPEEYPLILEGTVELDPPVMEITLTTESYMTILRLIHPSFLDRILSANVSYILQRAD